MKKLIPATLKQLQKENKINKQFGIRQLKLRYKTTYAWAHIDDLEHLKTVGWKEASEDLI